MAGVIMIFVGFGAAFRITFLMGWRNAFGEPTGLRTEGWFQHSRNPVYVATWIGLIGWGLVIPDPFIRVLLAFWGLLYLLAPLFEEPWLEREYGQAYLAYKKSTPRFFAGF
ncbi:MAG: methyltransferase [Henriciella sp.]